MSKTVNQVEHRFLEDPSVQQRSAKATLKALLERIMLLVSLPTLLPCAFTTEKQMIVKDANRWLEVLDRAHYTRLLGLLHLLAHYPEFRSLYYYRLKKGNLLPLLFLAFLKWFYRAQTNLFIYCDHVGAGLFIQHGFDTVIAAERIGDNCWVNQQVTVGHTAGGHAPTIGSNVTMTAGAKILGNISLGDNVVVGANAVVVKSVPANCTVVGIPASIVKRDGMRVREKLGS